MADFRIAQKEVMNDEGGSNFHPADKGNVVVNGVVTLPTYRGIAPVFWRGWPGWNYVKRVMETMKPMPTFNSREFWAWKKKLDSLLAQIPALQALVDEFYLATFWNANRLGEIESQAVATWVYGHIVNGGARGAMWAQLAARVHPDGDIGPITIRAINAMPAEEFLQRAGDIAGAHRIDKGKASPSQIPFLADWLERDGQPPGIIAMVKAAARDGILSDSEATAIKGAMEAQS